MTDIVFDPTKDKEFYYSKMIDFKNKFEAEKNKNDLLLEQKKKKRYDYFLEHVQKTKKKCNLCNVEVCVNSFSNHLKTKKHLLKEFTQEGLDIPTQQNK